MKKRAARLLRWLGLALLLPALLYAILLGLATFSLQRAYDVLRRDGRPLDVLSTLAARSRARTTSRRPSSGGNGAYLFQAAALRLQAEPAPGAMPVAAPGVATDLLGYATQRAEGFIKDPSDQKTADELRALFQNAAVQDALHLLKAGAAKGTVFYGLHYEGPNTLLPHLAQLRACSRLLCAQARLQAMDGGTNAAWQTACTALAVADAPHDEVFPISQQVRCGHLEQTTATIRVLCERSPPDAGSRASLLERLTLADDDQALLNALDGDRLTWTDMFAFSRSALRDHFAMYSGQESVSFGRKVLLESWFPPAWRADQAATLRLALELARLAQRPYSREDDLRFEAMVATLPFYCQLTRRGFGQDSVGNPWRHVRARGRYLSMQAQARLTRTGLALVDYRQQHGRYPNVLDAIEAGRLTVGPLRSPTAAPWESTTEEELLQAAKARCLSDPFSRNPLVYRAEADGFVLYSVGPDQKDDGGAEQAQPQAGESGLTADIVWRYREPATARP